MSPSEITRVVDQAIVGRRSVRAFLPKDIPRETIEEILQVAARAPSGSNIQPWKVYVLTGAKKDLLSQTILDIFNDPEKNAQHRAEYIYYPQNWVEPFLARRRKIGYDLYALANIARGEHAKMHQFQGNNYSFFGAPVALMLTIPRVMEQGSWLDFGMFMQNIMIAASARAIASCPQAALISYHQVVCDVLEIPQTEQYICTISLGYEDTLAQVNQLQTQRAQLADFVKFC